MQGILSNNSDNGSEKQTRLVSMRWMDQVAKELG